MSIFSAQINFPKTDISPTFLKDVAKIIATIAEQPIEKINGGIVENTKLIWRGSTKPAMLLVIQTTSPLNLDINEDYTAKISKYIENTTTLPKDRVLLSFIEKVASDIALNGATLHQYT